MFSSNYCNILSKGGIYYNRLHDAAATRAELMFELAVTKRFSHYMGCRGKDKAAGDDL